MSSEAFLIIHTFYDHAVFSRFRKKRAVIDGAYSYSIYRI